MNVATEMDAYRLLHEGVQALSDIEQNGMLLDLEHFEHQAAMMDRRLARAMGGLDGSALGKKWREVYGHKMSWSSNDQLSKVLTHHFQCDVASVDKNQLAKLDVDGIQHLLELRKWSKCKTTYVEGIVNEAVNGVVHPSFNLHLTVTFRSSSDSPNFQNIPKRDKELQAVVRTGIIARPGHQLVEVDISGAEVRVAAAYHNDPTMIQYITDPTKDMHRDCAADCYKLPVEEVTKKIRYNGKNMFVFPQFYGSYYKACAEALWEGADGLTTESGVPLKDHLKKVRLGSYEAFEEHVHDVEDIFWRQRFPVYRQWKFDWYDEYLRNGFFHTLTGFRCSGVMSRNDVTNYPVQGSAFHCLLWSLTQMHNWLKARNMRSMIIGQIHDSIIFDVAPDELNHVLRKTKRVMCQDTQERFPWLVVPLDIEAEVSEIDGNWAEMHEVKLT